MLTTGQKWLLSLAAGILFFLISMPFTYELTDKVFGSIAHTSYADGPTWLGLSLHTIVFALLFRVILMFF